MFVFLSRRFSGCVTKSESAITFFRLQCLVCARDWPPTLVTSFYSGLTLTPIRPEGVRRRELRAAMRIDVPANDVTDLFSTINDSSTTEPHRISVVD
jgi:hypothetical protein